MRNGKDEKRAESSSSSSPSSSSSSSTSIRPLLGQYGFLTDYPDISKEEAKEKIQALWDLGVREFQFYDWFVGYATPLARRRYLLSDYHDWDNDFVPGLPPEIEESWMDPFFKTRQISAKTIINYINAIKESGGRAWAYVQAVGSEWSDN